MGTDIELISDGEGLLIVGSQADVDEFLAAEGLRTAPREPSRVESALRAGLAIAEVLTTVSETSGQWVKLTKESSEAIKKFGLMDTKTAGVKHAMVGKPGAIKQWIQIASSPSSLASNPAVLSGAAGIMAQLAMEQMVAEITDYLEAIDKKLDAVLRAQTNQVLARMDGIEFMLREAASVRESVGRVSEVTWSKMQHSSSVILETQAFALRQLADLADRLEAASKVDDLADLAEEAEAETQKWLNVLARCVQLHDSIAVVELDRVMDASPDELEQHLVGLRAARQQRLELFTRATGQLLDRMSSAVGTANSKVLFNPTKSPAVIRSSNHVAESVQSFHEVLSIEHDRQSAEARRWIDAASDSWSSVRETSADGVDVVKSLGAGTWRQARSMKSRLSEKVADHVARRSDPDEPDTDT